MTPAQAHLRTERHTDLHMRLHFFSFRSDSVLYMEKNDAVTFFFDRLYEAVQCVLLAIIVPWCYKCIHIALAVRNTFFFLFNHSIIFSFQPPQPRRPYLLSFRSALRIHVYT